MADKKGAGPITKKVETKKPVSINESKKPVIITEIKKPVPINGPTSKQAFRRIEEEQRARLAKQRKAEEEWLQKLIEKEEDRRKRIQKIVTKEDEQKSAQRVNADKKGADDARRNLIRSLETEQRQMRAEQMKRVKAIHRTQMLDRIVEETECTTSRNQGSTIGENQEPGKESKGALITC